jgi:hypothetical protein
LFQINTRRIREERERVFYIKNMLIKGTIFNFLDLGYDFWFPLYFFSLGNNKTLVTRESNLMNFLRVFSTSKNEILVRFKKLSC